MPDSSDAGQHFMDLGDFIPEEYELRFSIRGHAYLFHYGEATVDEVLTILWESQEQLKTGLEAQRRTVTEFLKNHLIEGDAATLEADLKCLPFKSSRGGLDMSALFEQISNRVKKNDPGESPKSPTV